MSHLAAAEILRSSPQLSSLIKNGEWVERNCDQHGAYKAWALGGEFEETGCPECKKVRSIVEHRANIEAEKEEIQKRKMQEFMESARVPKIYKSASTKQLDGYVRDKCVEFLSNYRSTESLNMIINGGVGSGKTHAVCAMVNFILYKKIVESAFSDTVLFETWHDMADKLRRASSLDSVEENPIELYKNVDLLVIDEVGGASLRTEAQIEWFFRIMNARYSEGKNTIITTNLNASQLEKTVGTRSYDRLMNGSSLTLEIKGKSRRQAIPKTL